MSTSLDSDGLVKAACIVDAQAGFTFAANCISPNGVNNVVRDAAGQYTITVDDQRVTTDGMYPQITLLQGSPVAGQSVGVRSPSAGRWEVTTATGGALADIDFAFELHLSPQR